MTEDLLEEHFSQSIEDATKECVLVPSTTPPQLVGPSIKNETMVELLSHSSNFTQLDDASCAMFTAAVPVEFAENLPEGAVLQIMQGSPDVETITLHASTLNDEDVTDSVETEVAIVHVPNYAHQETDTSNPIKLSEVAMNYIDLSFLTESDEAPINNDEMQSIDSALENQSVVNASEQQYFVQQDFDAESPNADVTDNIPSPESDNTIIVDVSKPIQLSQNSLITVDGQRCILQHDPETGQVVAYPVTQSNTKPKRGRGRPKKTSLSHPSPVKRDLAVTLTPPPSQEVEHHQSEEEHVKEKGFSQIVNDDGALVRRSLRKRKKNKVLNDYETGNLNHELGSDAEEKHVENEVVVILSSKKRIKTKGPGRPRKHSLLQDLLTEGKRPRGRPSQQTATQAEATQAFLIQMADGQTVMMQVPTSSIPDGMDLEDVAHGIASNINFTVPQVTDSENFTLDNPETESVVTNVSEFLNPPVNLSSVCNQVQSPLLLPNQTMSVESSTPMKSILLPSNSSTSCSDTLAQDFLTVNSVSSSIEYINDPQPSLTEKFPENFMDEKELNCVLDERDFSTTSNTHGNQKEGETIIVESCEQLILPCGETEMETQMQEFTRHLNAANFSLGVTEGNVSVVHSSFAAPAARVDNLLSVSEAPNSVNCDTTLNIKHSVLFDHEYGARKHYYEVAKDGTSCANNSQENRDDIQLTVACETLKDPDVPDSSNMSSLNNSQGNEDGLLVLERSVSEHPVLQEVEISQSTTSKKTLSDIAVMSWPEVASILAVPGAIAGVMPTEATTSSVSTTTVVPLKISDKIMPLFLKKANASGMALGLLDTFTCSKCNFHTEQAPQFKQHLLEHAADLKFCKCCKFCCFVQEELFSHYRATHPKCICTECDYVADHPYIIRRHMFRHAENGYTCTVCSKKYKDHYILKMHMKMVHLPAEVLYQCDVCQKQFNRKAHLKRHLRTHDPVKAYKCALCPYRGCEKSDITKHRLIHEDPKHACDVCGKIFRHVKNKELHMKRHIGQREYQCSVCEFKGYTYTDIRKHIERRHRGGAELLDTTCTSCNETFISADELKEHECANDHDNVPLVENVVNEVPMLSELGDCVVEQMTIDIEPVTVDVMPVTIDVPSDVTGDLNLNRSVLKLLDMESTNVACDISFIAS